MTLSSAIVAEGLDCAPTPGTTEAHRPGVTQRRQRTPRPDDGRRGLSKGAMMPSRPLAMISAMSAGVKRMCLKIRVKGTSRSRAFSPKVRAGMLR